MTETDDFADDKEMQRLRKIKAQYDALIEECTNIAVQGLALEPVEDVTELSVFELLKIFGEINAIDVYRTEQSNHLLEILLINYHWVFHAAKNSGSGDDHCFFGILTLSKEFPHTYISKETIKEKVIDWFIKADVDFHDHRKFSSRFHVVTEDSEKLRLLLMSKPLDELAVFPGMQMEIHGNKCLFRNSDQPVTVESAKEFVALTKMLSRIFH